MITFPHQNWDISTILFFNKFCGKSQFLDTFALVFLSVDALRTAILVALIFGIWEYANFKNDTNLKTRVIFILFSIVVTLGIIEIMNAVIESPRPIVMYESLIKSPIVTDDTKLLWNDGWVRNPKHGSFPSDTVALLATMAFGIFLWNRFLGISAIIFVLIFGVLPRLYFGLHYPSDMLFGMLISLVSTLAVEKFILFKVLAKKIINIQEKYPYLFGVLWFYMFYIIAEKFILLRKLPIWIRTMLRH